VPDISVLSTQKTQTSEQPHPPLTFATRNRSAVRDRNTIMGREERASRRVDRINARRGSPVRTAQATEDLTFTDDLAFVDDNHGDGTAAAAAAAATGDKAVASSPKKGPSSKRKKGKRKQKSPSRNNDDVDAAVVRTAGSPSKGKPASNSNSARVEGGSHRDTRRDVDVGGGDDDDDDDDDEEERPGAVRVGNRHAVDVERGGINNVAALKGEDEEHDDVMDSADFVLPLASAVTAAEIPINEDEEFMQKVQKDAEEAFLSKVAKAEVFDEEEREKQLQKKRRTIVIWSMVIALVVIGVVVGVVVAFTGRSDDGAQDENVVDPTTFDNITATALSCDAALAVNSLPTVITGSTAESTIDDSFEACGDVSANGAGVWYTLQGAGRPLSLSTCFGSSYDTQLSVYVGDSCSSTKCVVANDQRTNCGRDGSHFTFLAEQGLSYFIFVHGLRRASGVFTLAIEEFAVNSNCAAATRIEDVDPTGEVTVFGSTKYSSVDDSLQDCLDTSITSPGAWYSFQAASTRFVQARADDYSSKVSVYTGSCNALQCGAASNVGRAMWTATAGIEYLIFVHGDGTQTSDFSLSILAGGLLRPSANVTNNKCDLALQLGTPTMDIPTMAEGSTALGLVADAPGCGSLTESSSKGMWYTVVGNGSGIRASTCDTDTGFVATVTVYQGDCLSLVCTDGGDQNCGDQSAVAWFGETGVQYYVLVQGIDESRTGDFTLKLEEVVPDVSTDCNAPIPVTLNDVSILGSTLEGQLENTGFCDNVEFAAPSVWYTVQGTGAPMVASTCDPNSANFAKIELYSGTCLTRSCIADVKKVACGDQLLIAWDSSPDESYLIQVYGIGSGVASQETFTLVVEELPDNYACPGASAGLSLGSSVRGSTLVPTSATTGDCTQDDAVGSWYKIDGNHNDTLTISACSRFTNFNPKLSVFHGNACGELECIATNNDQACGAGSFISWEALPSEVYFVLVQGGGADEYGNFEIRLGPENDICDSAIGPLAVNGGPVLGSTLHATNEANSDDIACLIAGISVDGPGVWYTVLGSGVLLKASTCSEQTTFDTQISVYEGSSCSALSCVAGNNNGGTCGNQSTATWYAEENQVYYLLIHGSELGDFALTVTEVENDSCADSQSVLLSGESEAVFGTNFVGESFFDPCTGTLVSDQLVSWWSISGTGHNVSINACGSDDASTQPTSISIYNQNCSNLTCQVFVENTCDIEFETKFLEEYTILVSNNLTNAGSSFEMEIESSNDSCGTSFGPLSVGDRVRGSTLGATEDYEAMCGEVTSRGAGVWYSFIGTGDSATIFTCSEFNDIDTQLTLYMGDSCGDLSCIASKQGNCGKDAWLQHAFDEGQTYYVLVSGKLGFSGNFLIQVE
jgi:hypothetical protein